MTQEEAKVRLTTRCRCGKTYTWDMVMTSVEFRSQPHTYPVRQSGLDWTKGQSDVKIKGKIASCVACSQPVQDNLV